MGTNYYAHLNPCPHCDRAERVIHIGKSSAGWCFALRVYLPDKWSDDPPIQTWADWKELLKRCAIRDEYGRTITAEQMADIVETRSSKARISKLEMDRNHAEPGPNGLLRHKLGDHCAGHGDGTWDYIVGEFS